MELPPKALARHRDEGQLAVKCHRIYKTDKSINVLIKPADAIKVAANILRKADLLTDEGLAEEWTVKLWSTGGDSLKFGLEAPKGKRRKKASKK